jgi:predicted sugar kinase
VARTVGLKQLSNAPGSGNAALALLLFTEGGLVVNVGHEKNQPEGWLKVAEATLETTAIKPYP